MDRIVRATAGSAQIRIFAAETKELVEEAAGRHHTTPVATAALGRLLTAGAMMGSMLKAEEDLLTLRITGDGLLGGIMVTADAKGNVKGYVDHPYADLPLNAKGKLDVAGVVGRGNLDVIRDMGLKEPYVGRTPLISGEIAEDLTYYFANSEQVPSSVGLGVLIDRDHSVLAAGGFILQLMPEAGDGMIGQIEENLKKITSVTSHFAAGKTAEDLINILADGMDPVITEISEPRFYCNCSKKRVEKALISLGKGEIESMISDGESIQLNCGFCNTDYTFSVDELIKLKESAK